mgnify:CR=1 FL=1
MFEYNIIESMRRFFEKNRLMNREEFYILTGIIVRDEAEVSREEVSQPCASTAEE